MTHPPMPTHCPYFESGFYFRYPERIAQTRVSRTGLRLDRVSRLERPIIAAVARCAWLDEYHKLDESSALMKATWDKDLDVIAWNNAQAWSKWGKNQPWK